MRLVRVKISGKAGNPTRTPEPEPEPEPEPDHVARSPRPAPRPPEVTPPAAIDRP